MKKHKATQTRSSPYSIRNLAIALAIGCLTLIVVFEVYSSFQDRKVVSEQIKAEATTIGQIQDVQANASASTPKTEKAVDPSDADKGIVWADRPRADVVEEYKPERKIIEHETLGKLVELTYPGNIKRYEFPAAGDEEQPE